MKRTLSEEIQDQQKRGVLLVVTGPTGAGKDTLFKVLQSRNQNIIKIITTTTREKRTNESEGNPYYFFSREDFTKKIEERAFFEWVEFRGEMYGTQKETFEKALAAGGDVVWRIDTRGVKNIKNKVKELTDRALFVFLTAPYEALAERVKKQEGEEGYTIRWNEGLVRWEMDQFEDCDYLVVNEEGKIEQTADKVQSIIQAKRLEIR